MCVALTDGWTSFASSIQGHRPVNVGNPVPQTGQSCGTTLKHKMSIRVFTTGRAAAQVVSHRISIAEAQVQAPVK